MSSHSSILPHGGVEKMMSHGGRAHGDWNGSEVRIFGAG